MKDEEFYTVIGYLTNPIREILTEVELPEHSRYRFENDYSSITSKFPIPDIVDTLPYYVWSNDDNKWAIETRSYFVSNGNMTGTLNAILELRGIQNRRSYENWQRRISTKEVIYRLFNSGFIFSDAQDETRILAFVSNNFIDAFKVGYEL